MKQLAGFLALASFLSPSLAFSQNAHAHAAASHATVAPAKTVPPFSGTWILNQKRSKIEAERPHGVSKAVIQYDGKTWHFIHVQMNGNDQLDDSWQITMTVNSPVYHVEKEEPLTFRSRLHSVGNTLVMEEYVRTDKGQHSRNTVVYSLEDDNNTLVELEKTKGPLGTETNRWVLERQGTGATAAAADSQPNN